MNKILKHTVSLVMLLTTFSTVNSTNALNIGTAKVYASSYDLTSLSMGSINLYKNENYTDELDDGDDIDSTYYAKLDPDDSNVSISTSADSDCVRITKSKSKRVYKQGDDIPILVGKTTLYISVYDNKDDCDNDKNRKEQYKINIKKYSYEEEKEAKSDTQDSIYLKSLELDYGDTPLGFRKDKMTYDVTVDKDIKSLAIKAMPEDGADTVKINGFKLDEEKGYKETVNLSEGTTQVEVIVSYYDEERKYIINITRSSTAKSNDDSVNNETSTVINEDKPKTEDNIENKTETKDTNITVNSNQNGWIKEGDKFKYIDDYGNVLKNTYFYDRSSNKTCYFDNDGYMKIGWLPLNNEWYYFDQNGAMCYGWKSVGTKWYYFNYDGKMKKGWLRDYDGKYYHLNDSTGEMEKNTVVGTYRLGADGAWVK